MTTLEGRSYPVAAQPAVARAEALDWQSIGQGLDEQGSAMLPGVLSPQECRALAGLYPEDDLFRSRVVMGRHGFGRGEYKYFNYPLPDTFKGFGPRSIAGLPLSRTNGTSPWAWMFVIPVNTPITSNDAMMPVSFVPLPCFSSMEKAITTAFTRISTESTFFQYKWPCCFLSLKGTSPAANSCSRNSVRGCNRDRR